MNLSLNSKVVSYEENETVEIEISGNTEKRVDESCNPPGRRGVVDTISTA